MLSAFPLPRRKECETVGRKNRRIKIEYRNRLGFDPRQYIGHRNTYRNYDGVRQCQDEEHHPYRIPYRGEVWFAELGYHHGTSIQDGCRPVLIISNDKGNHSASTIVVLPMTSRLKKYGLPSHVELRQENLVNADPNRPLENSMVLVEQITTISKLALRNYVGKVEAAEKLAEIDNAVRLQLGMLE